MPGPQAGGQYIASDGSLVAPGTQGAAPPLARPLTGEEVKTLLRTGSAPAGTDQLRSGLCQLYPGVCRRG